MKSVIAVAAVVLLLAGCAGPGGEEMSTDKGMETDMHRGQPADVAGAVYSCPMHPKVVTKDASAKCPDCGMNLTKVEGEVKMTCPMHPEFVTNDPDARCPECGMKLDRVIEEEAETQESMNMSGDTVELVFTCPDISCGGCANHIKGAVAAKPGVSSVEVDVETKQVTIKADSGAVSREDAISFLKEAGYPAQI